MTWFPDPSSMQPQAAAGECVGSMSDTRLMEARREFSIRLAAKGTTTTVIVGGLLALGSPEPPHAPPHAGTHWPLIGLSANLGIDGATAMHPEAVIQPSQIAASGAIGASQRFKFNQNRFSGVSLPPDPPRSA